MKEVIPGQPTILLVEDDEGDADLAWRAFQKTAPNFNFKHVGNGAAAIAYLAAEGTYKDRARFPFPDLMILDMKMPLINGKEVLDWIKAHPEIGKVWVTILTGESQPARAKAMFETHGNVTICHAEFLKPPSVQLAETMLNIFEQWQNLQKGK